MNESTTDSRAPAPPLHAVGPTAQAILEDDYIQSYIQSHQAIKPRIEKAAKVLKGKPDAIAAVKRLIPSLEKGVVHIFFSYKNKDERTARTIVDQLCTYSD
ncbi:MAG: hypothetical protein OEM83_09095, partial [Gammaproteobacteria bacterium]|nr:hypothetical protein [Gammaproteobacteria bacterium]